MSTPSRQVRAEKMTNHKRALAKTLYKARNTSLLSSAFNEIDMSSVLEIRSVFQKDFREKHGAMLSITSFFVRAACMALREYPTINSRMTENEILYPLYCDISVAVNTPKALFVPVIRNAECLNLAGIEKKMFELSVKAFRNKLTFTDTKDGTFTITNGGVFGSLISTPIINTPQSAILGMHQIQERPVAIHTKTIIKPLMYVTITYDQRLINEYEASGFLNEVKELIENPARLLL